MMNSFQENYDSSSSLSSSDSTIYISDLLIPIHKEKEKTNNSIVYFFYNYFYNCFYNCFKK